MSDHPREGMSKFARALTDAQVDNSSDGSSGTYRATRPFHIQNQPQEVLADVFAPLSRFNIDSAQFTCRRFRGIVETRMTTVCLRDLRHVEMRRMGKEKVHDPHTHCRGDRLKSENMGEASKEQDWSYIVRCEFTRKIGTQSKGEGQDEVKRSVMFRLAKDAGQYLLGLIRSSTLGSLVFDACTPQEAFFKSLATTAPTVRVRDLSLRNCAVSHIDASLLHDALLQFSSIERLTLGNRLKAHQITDQFLEAACEKLITRFTVDSKPVDADVYEVTDVGIQAFLFQTTTKPVEMRISHVAVSPMFCADLFKRALEDPAENELVLTIKHVNTSEQNFTGILEYDTPSGEIHRFHTHIPSGTELRLWVDQFEEMGGGDIQVVSFHRFKAAAPGWTRRGGGDWTSDDDNDTEEDDAAMDPQQ
ncbi:hypothetical protein AAVH_25071 [Aphelenchoides avenae]|nr:hypothetical protein AAVH_25071 [Aphelenchus avenae]